jgi:ParB-like chromosome segregation protein Spo0J
VASSSILTADHIAQASIVAPIDSVHPHPRNANRGDVEAIRESLRVHGQFRTIVVQKSTGNILAGNSTWAAAKAEGFAEIAAILLDVDDEQAVRILIADNRLAELGEGYDERLLAELLGSLPDLEGTGFEGDELQEMLDRLAEEALSGAGDGEGDDVEADTDLDAGTLLALSDVTVGEPNHQPAHGSRWRVGEHLLVVAKLSDEHHLWAGDLDGRVFCPYPNPYLTASTLAQESRLLLAQPNRYLAGHLLDKHEALFPGTVDKT